MRGGLLDAVITQNIDRLHSRAGSRELIEVHGTIATSSCLSCGARVELDEARELSALLDELGLAPRSDRSTSAPGS